MQNKLFLKAADICELLEVKQTSAYEIIGNLNKELEEQGYLTLRGKVPTKYFVKRFYGVEDTCEIPQEEGKEYQQINGEAVPTQVVKSRLLKVGYEHIQYVFFSLDRSTSKVKNIRQYMLTVLYNAPATINQFYDAEVRHDMYWGKDIPDG